MRTIVELTDIQVQRLAEYTTHLGISRAEAIRRAVDALLGADEMEHRRRVLLRTAGAWKHLGIDGLDFQQKLREEWER